MGARTRESALYEIIGVAMIVSDLAKRRWSARLAGLYEPIQALSTGLIYIHCNTILGAGKYGELRALLAIGAMANALNLLGYMPSFTVHIRKSKGEEKYSHLLVAGTPILIAIASIFTFYSTGFHVNWIPSRIAITIAIALISCEMLIINILECFFLAKRELAESTLWISFATLTKLATVIGITNYLKLGETTQVLMTISISSILSLGIYFIGASRAADKISLVKVFKYIYATIKKPIESFRRLVRKENKNNIVGLLFPLTVIANGLPLYAISTQMSLEIVATWANTMMLARYMFMPWSSYYIRKVLSLEDEKPSVKNILSKISKRSGYIFTGYATMITAIILIKISSLNNSASLILNNIIDTYKINTELAYYVVLSLPIILTAEVIRGYYSRFCMARQLFIQNGIELGLLTIGLSFLNNNWDINMIYTLIIIASLLGLICSMVDSLRIETHKKEVHENMVK